MNNFASFRLIIILISMISCISFSAKAQETWSLTKCIDYALENNINLNIEYNKIKTQKYNLSESKASILPSLNTGSSVNMNFGRNIDANTNDITHEQTLSNNYWISSSITLFQGLVKYNTIRYNKFLLSANKEEALMNKNKLIFDILTSYYTALYSKGLVETAQSQLELSDMQYKRMQKMEEIGRESSVKVQELKSLRAGDKFSLTLAENNMSRNVLKLKQLLRIDANESFEIIALQNKDFVVFPELNIDSVYNTAVEILPEIKRQEFLYKASIKNLSVAKGGILPEIYLAAGYNTNYFDGDDTRYGNQIKNNQNQQIRMGINVPIFNRASVYSRIKRNQIAVKNQEYQLEKHKEILYAEIWTATDEFRSAGKEYQSSVELHKYSKLTLKNMTKKMEKGMASITDYEAAKQRFMSAEAALLKARLIYFMRKEMLEFYRTGTWVHLN